MVALAQAAEDLDFASIWTSEHVLVPARMFHPFGDNLDSLTTLTFLAGCTRRVKLGTSILVLPPERYCLEFAEVGLREMVEDGQPRIAVR